MELLVKFWKSLATIVNKSINYGQTFVTTVWHMFPCFYQDFFSLVNCQFESISESSLQHQHHWECLEAFGIQLVGTKWVAWAICQSFIFLIPYFHQIIRPGLVYTRQHNSKSRHFQVGMPWGVWDTVGWHQVGGASHMPKLHLPHFHPLLILDHILIK